MRLSAVVLLMAGATLPVVYAQEVPEPAGIQFKSGVNEILLDMVVTDKRGRPILDLKKEEVSLTDDGVKQEVRGFRLVDRAIGENSTVAKSRQPQLVTLVFESL